MPQYSVVGRYNDGNNEREVHTIFDLQISPRPQHTRATAAILIIIFIDYEYNYSVPGGNRQSKNCQCLIQAQFAKFSSRQPFWLYGMCICGMETIYN